MGGAAAVVDGNAVLLGADEAALAAKAREQFLRDPGGGAVGAVEQHFQTGEVGVDMLLQEVDVILYAGAAHLDAADVRALGQTNVRAVVEDVGFDLVLDLIGQFVAVALEDLDAVELHRVVGGGDHDAGVGMVFADQVGHAGGGDNAQQLYVSADTAQAGGQGGFQHIAGHTGIFADQDFGAVAVQAGKHGSGTAADLKRQFAGEVLARHTADTISTKQFTHSRQILSYWLIRLIYHSMPLVGMGSVIFRPKHVRTCSAVRHPHQNGAVQPCADAHRPSGSRSGHGGCGSACPSASGTAHRYLPA